MKRKLLFLIPFLSAIPIKAQEPATDEKPAAPAEPIAETDPAVIKANSSYGFGFNNGTSFKQQMTRFGLSPDDIDKDEFIKGFMDALDGKTPANGEQALNAAMLGLRNQIQEREKVIAEENLQAAEAFLAENAKREGVITTDSGLQYEILKAGDGEKYDGAEGSKFLANYKGTLLDGFEFDASPEGTPVPLTLNRIPGVREALISMPVGSKWKLFIKPELGFGDKRRSDKIGPNSVLSFELELVEIQKATPRPKAVSPPIQIPPAPTKPE